MELEDLKKNWNTFSEQLNKNEILNQRIIRDMIIQRTDSTLQKLINTEFVGGIFIIVMTIFTGIIADYLRYPGITTGLICGVMALAGLWNMYKAYTLTKINMDEDNILSVESRLLRYKQLITGEMIAIVPYIIIASAAIVLSFPVLFNSNLIIYALINVVVIPPAMYFGHIYYKKKFKELNKNIREFKEFKEDIV